MASRHVGSGTGRATLLLGAAVALALAAPVASAGERGGNRGGEGGHYGSGSFSGRHHGYGHSYGDGGGIVIPHGGGYGDTGLPTFVRGLGTFAGSISAVRDRGNGIYFAVDGDLTRMRPVAVGVAPSAVKIITVTDRTEAESCSYEAGVCVIRP